MQPLIFSLLWNLFSLQHITSPELRYYWFTIYSNFLLQFYKFFKTYITCVTRILNRIEYDEFIQSEDGQMFKNFFEKLQQIKLEKNDVLRMFLIHNFIFKPEYDLNLLEVVFTNFFSQRFLQDFKLPTVFMDAIKEKNVEFQTDLKKSKKLICLIFFILFLIFYLYSSIFF